MYSNDEHLSELLHLVMIWLDGGATAALVRQAMDRFSSWKF